MATEKWLYLVNLKCGKHNKKTNITGKSTKEIDEIKKNLVYDKKKFILIIY
jgi:hypothetical protein